MKKGILVALMILPAITWAQKDGYTVNGKVGTSNAPAKVYLSYRSDGQNKLDSSDIKAGVFQFKGTMPGIRRAMVIIDHNGVGASKLGKQFDGLMFYIDKGIITITTTKDSVKYGKITGSPINAEYERYKSFVAAPDLTIKNINDEYEAAPAEKKKDEAYLKTLQTRYDLAVAQKEQLQKKYISKNPGSYFSLQAIKEMISGGTIEVTKTEPLFKGLSASIRNSAEGKEVEKLIYKERATSIGSIAPDFTQNDVDDKPIKLSDFRGKYVLLDFWASWCRPCRQENPNVVKAYNTFKDKNFTVLGVSLDQGKKEDWLKAIKKDGLTWMQVSDLKGWENEVAGIYGIRSIPQNYLIDPTGKIIGKNLRGEELEKKLAETLKAN